MFVHPKRAEYAYKVTASNCLSTDCKHETYGTPLLIVFNMERTQDFIDLFYISSVTLYMGGYAALIIILINTNHEQVATVDN